MSVTAIAAVAADQSGVVDRLEQILREKAPDPQGFQKIDRERIDPVRQKGERDARDG